jgi:hypothetical protein
MNRITTADNIRITIYDPDKSPKLKDFGLKAKAQRKPIKVFGRDYYEALPKNSEDREYSDYPLTAQVYELEKKVDWLIQGLSKFPERANFIMQKISVCMLELKKLKDQV